jgi:5-hydroxyisourate hydrolase-like protein (transthyretin family)
MAACSCTKSELYYASAIAARNKAQAIYNAVNPIVASLSTYGVTAAVLTALKSAIDAFAAAIPTPQLSVSDRKELNLKMDRTLDDAELQLSKIDAMVEVVRLTQPVFYSQYKDARRIIISNNSLSLKGNVLDAETGKALSGVQLNIEPLAEQTSKMAVLSSTKTSSIKRLTAPKGGFRIKNLPQGSYQLKASIPGYADQTITVHIVDGQRSDIDLNLERFA